MEKGGNLGAEVLAGWPFGEGERERERMLSRDKVNRVAARMHVVCRAKVSRVALGRDPSGGGLGLLGNRNKQQVGLVYCRSHAGCRQQSWQESSRQFGVQGQRNGLQATLNGQTPKIS